MEQRTTIVIADDHPLVLVGLRKALEIDGSFDVVGEARGGPELLPVVGRTDPDVVLVDIDMPELDGLACLDRLQERHPNVKVVMLAPELDRAMLDDAFARGATGYIVMDVEVKDLGSALRAALQGGAYEPYGVATPAEQLGDMFAGLSKRELDILEAVGRGLSNKEIAAELWIAQPTVKFHLTSVYRKLGVSNRTGAARWAFANGMRPKSPA
jgi:DNA-binding NarL/FixJ family response regulator